MRHRILLAAAITAALLAVPVAAPAAPRCDPDGSDAAAVTGAHDDVDRSCDCSAATSPAAYVRCSRTVIDRRVADGGLPRQCIASVRSWARRSTCGRAGAVACCVKTAHGPWRPRLRAAACRAPGGGAACTSSATHLDDACSAAYGCSPVPCGDGFVDLAASEQCEPPGTGTCDATCRYVHECGNGIVELGEECDGQAVCDASCRLRRTLCCQLGEVCFDGGATDIFGEYFFSKGCGYTLGGSTSYGICEGTLPCPDAPPGLDCKIGTCGDEPIDPLPLCCQHPDGTCSGHVATTAGGVSGCGWGTFPPPDHGDVEHLIVGTCGGDGRCVPLAGGGSPP